MWRTYSEQGDFVELEGVKHTSDKIILHAFETYAFDRPVPVPMKNYHFKPILTLKEATESLGNQMRIVRELAYESIRKEFYSELPSRHNCIWLMADDKRSIEFWKNILRSKTQRVFKVTIDGKIHRAANKWLIGGTMPLIEIYTMAHKYWKGEGIGNFDDEILFEGKLKILEEIEK